ncbi:TonB-dependent receptor [Polaribacter sp. ALD11]|uniref:TonB-dependent receptor plug domain-containing protein n=1 Tax=Polaribacter sp. ALD11 TaxID=2058137 RepID=UPI000C308445|nr:TonB-dependent receptor plug domain-containing protein [Polaribacter sp. ALD11]AUC85315.1 TonB-dependent receptor [Polaribacter sp. ALD11]
MRTSSLHFFWAIFLIFGLHSSYSLYAQEKDTTKTVQLKEIFLISNKEKLKKHSSPTPLQSLTGKALSRLGNYSVADAIRFFSGVQLKDYGGIGGIKTINVRGMGSQHTGVFYDGVQLGNAQNGQIDLGKYSVQNMEAVSLYQGQRSDLNQSAKSYASSNSIYLKSKTPQFSHGKKINTNASVKTGSFGLINPSVNLDFKINKYLSARLSTEYLTAHGRYKFRYTNGSYDTIATRNNADIVAFRVEASLHSRQGKNNDFNIKLYHYDSERGLPGAIVANRFKRPQRLWDRNNFVQGAYTNHVNDYYFFVLRGKYAHNYSRYVDPEIIKVDGELDNRYTQEEYYLSMVHTFQVFPFWKLSLATDVQKNTMDANLYRFSYPKRITLLSALAAEFSFNKIKIQASLLSTTVDETVEYYEAAEDLQKYTPSLMLNWQPFNSNKFRVRSFYKRIFRMPTFNDLYYTFIGNTFLDPEDASQVNFGFSYQPTFKKTTFDIQADVYKIWIGNKIVAVPGANLFRWSMLNLGKVETTGIETNMKASGSLGAKFHYTTNLSYTYQESIDVTANASNYGDQIPYIPRHSGSVSAMIDYKKLEFNYSFIYTGERYSQKANINSNYLQPWYTHDLSLGKTIFLNENKLKILVEVNNVFNQQYAVVKNFPMPGRSYRFTLNFIL